MLQPTTVIRRFSEIGTCFPKLSAVAESAPQMITGIVDALLPPPLAGSIFRLQSSRRHVLSHFSAARKEAGGGGLARPLSGLELSSKNNAVRCL